MCSSASKDSEEVLALIDKILVHRSVRWCSSGAVGCGGGCFLNAAQISVSAWSTDRDLCLEGLYLFCVLECLYCPGVIDSGCG